MDEKDITSGLDEAVSDSIISTSTLSKESKIDDVGDCKKIKFMGTDMLVDDGPPARCPRMERETRSFYPVRPEVRKEALDGLVRLDRHFCGRASH